MANNGLEALERLSSRGANAFDVVLMDLQMPVLDGIETTRRLRAQPAFDALPIYAMTAHALADERQRCLAVGMRGHIAKPLDVAALLRTLQVHVPQAAPLPTPPAAPVSPPADPGRVSPRLALPGLDVEQALGRFGGYEALYRRTLRGFAQQHGDGIDGWSVWLRAGRWDELRRAAHTLNGLAGTIGAADLAAQAHRVEQAAAAHDADLAAAALPVLAARLAEVVAQIDHAFQATPAWLDTGASVPAEMAAAVEPQAALQTLHELLESCDSRALDWWQAQQPALRQALSATAARRVGQAMNQLDFDAALAALGEVVA